MSYEMKLSDAAREMVARLKGNTSGAPADAASSVAITNPELCERLCNFAFDEVVSATSDQLDDRARALCWIATLLGCQGLDVFRPAVAGALNVGVDPVAIREVVYQAFPYLGVGRILPFVVALDELLGKAGNTLPLEGQAKTTTDEASRFAGGEEAQVACFGEQMRGFRTRGNADYPWINEWLVKNCFGDYYARGGLTIAEREMVTFCFIAAQGGCEKQLRSHVEANVHVGNDRDFLIAVVSNNVPFIGYPRSLNALAVVDEVTGA